MKTMLATLLLLGLLVSPAHAAVGPVLDHCYFEWNETLDAGVTFQGFNMYLGVSSGGPYIPVGSFAAAPGTGSLQHYGPTGDLCGAQSNGQKYAVVTALALDGTETQRSNEVAFCLQRPGSTVCTPPPPPVAPVIASISPTQVTAGTGDFTLTMFGSGFISGAVVQFGGTVRTTIFDSATQVHAVITAADIATAKTVQVSVKNPDGLVSNSATLTVVAAPPPPPPPPPKPCKNHGHCK